MTHPDATDRASVLALRDLRRSTRWLLLLAALFVLSLPLVTPRVYAVDEIQYFAYLPSVLHDGDLDFRDEFEALLADRRETTDWGALLEVEPTPRGLLPNYGGIGCALLWLPWYLGAELIARIGPWPADGLSWPYQVAVSYASTFYAFAGLLLLFAVGRRHVGDTAAGIGVLAAWWATAMPFYMYVTPPMSHATSFFAVSAFIVAWLEWRERPGARRAFLVGILGGLMAVVREMNALFLVLPALEFGARVWREPRRATGLTGPALAMAGGFALPLIPQLIVWHQLFGTLGPPPSRVGFLQPWPSFLDQVLLSSERGLLVWHPVWILGIVGLGLLARRHPGFGGPLLAAFLLQLWFLGSAANWSGGMAFGQRRLLGSTFVVALGTAELVRRGPRRAVVGSLVVLVWLNLSLAIQFGTGMIPRQGDVSWSRVARNHVVEVPRRGLEIARRYLLERSTFWDEPEDRADS